MRSKNSFTLIEVLVVIAILGILASLVSGNLINSMKRGRDSKRKEDLQQIKNALEMYYEDNGQYPPDNKVVFGSPFVHPSIATKVYMQKLPQDPSSGYTYEYVPTIVDDRVTAYHILSHIENGEDKGPGVRFEGYYPECCTDDSATCRCSYGVSSSNKSMDDVILTWQEGGSEGDGGGN